MSTEKRFGADGESSEAKRAKQETEHVFDINLLQKFYHELFPAKEFVEWLTYAYSDDPSQREDFRKRELSFTLSNEVYMRYRGFSDAESLRSELTRLVPIKIDIGGIYNMDVRGFGGVVE